MEGGRIRERKALSIKSEGEGGSWVGESEAIGSIEDKRSVENIISRRVCSTLKNWGLGKRGKGINKQKEEEREGCWGHGEGEGGW